MKTMVLPPVNDVELLLEAARDAVPSVMDPHPCATSCLRVGGPCEILPSGKCAECSHGPTTCRPRALRELVEGRPELLVALCEGFLLLRRTMDHPAVMAAAHAAATEPHRTVLAKEKR
jgi:hypothetical protein